MVYPPEDGHPSQLKPGPTCVNFVHCRTPLTTTPRAANSVTLFACCELMQHVLLSSLHIMRICSLLKASFTVHYDLIKHQRIIWGRPPHPTGFGIGPPSSLVRPCIKSHISWIFLAYFCALNLFLKYYRLLINGPGFESM